jgi:hypothetical protein
VPATISPKVNTQNNIHGKFPSQTIEHKFPSQPIERKLPSQTSERKFPSSGEPVPNNSGGARRAGWFLLQNIPPTLKTFPHLLKLEKSQKKPSFTVSRNILEPKEVTFENRNKTICFLSVFSVLIYIFEEITSATK